MKKLFLFVLISIISFVSIAEEKHPRVAELEDKYKGDTMKYLEARFPGLPFSVSVSIEPLRRTFGTPYNVKGENLPFYAVEEEEIRDEWDDPTITLYSLSNRVKRIQLTIQVPSDIKDEELADIKNNLGQILRLIPARDEVEIVKREWNLFPKLKWYLTLGISSILAFLFGLFIISYLSVKRVTRTLEKIQTSNNSRSSGGNFTPPSLSLRNESANQNSGQSGDIRFNDPIKIREVLDGRIEDLVKHRQDFLRLENMILLDKFASENPKAFGALFVLFPVELKRELFAYSSGPHWLEALTEPGEINMKCLEILEELGHVKTTQFRASLQKLIIQVWRLDCDHSAIVFLKNIESQSALSILSEMPKFISIPLAREVFPGNWATLLDSTYKFKELSDKECEVLFEKSLERKNLAKLEDLDVYKKDRELVKFLRTVDIRTEREVYNAIAHDSMLHMLRPPFYIIFEQEKHILENIIPRFTVSDWAVALFNVPRDERKIIEAYFEAREKVFYLEMLQGLDKNRPSPELQGDIRTQIAKLLPQIIQDFINSELDGINGDLGEENIAA
ncbi:MAG: hypothetical protein H6625_00070 [Bdellovibrionaceae bacterium]|nr:hypothetical protein [Pseudobdellovibrionaceae bacterium]